MKKRNLKKLVSKSVATLGAFSLTLGVLGGLTVTQEVKAENPMVQHIYTADPSPLVVGDTIYVYTTRDELKDQKSKDWSLMNEWRCFSSKDMINWTDHGQIAHADTFDRESKNKANWRAWAMQVVEMPIKNDKGDWEKKYFLIAPFNGTKIDIAVADTPTGPFKDATPGKYLIDGGWAAGNIDPTIYIEDHGNPDDYENYDVYLYWGNPYIRYCKLTNDMVDVDPDTDGDGVVSEDESVPDPRFSNEDNKILGKVRPGLHSFDTLGKESYKQFGQPSKEDGVVNEKNKYPAEAAGTERERSAFEEGPWVYKHDDGKEGTDDYFLVFVGGRLPETCEYSTAPTPLGPWTYRGCIFDRKYNFSCIHPGVETYKGHNYLFYLNNLLIGGDGSNRNVAVKEFTYDENNLIKRETPESDGSLLAMGIEETDPTGKSQFVKGNSYFSVDPVGTLNPFELNQAETICWESNLKGPSGGFNGTGAGIETKAKFPFTDKDPITGREAFWQSAFFNGVVVCDIDNEDFIRVREVDFGDEGAKSFTATAACGLGTPLAKSVKDSKGIEIFNPNADTFGGKIEIWLDYKDNDKKKQVGTLEIGQTGSTNTYKEFKANLTETVTGKHDVDFIYKTAYPKLKGFSIDTWQFGKESVTPTVAEPVPSPSPTPEATPVPTAEPTPTVAPPVTTEPAPVTPSVAPQTPQTPEAVTVAKVKSVKAKASKGKVKISWKKVSGAKGYEGVTSLDKKGKKSAKKFKATKNSVVVKKLKKGKKYYVKVRAYKKSAAGKKVYGAYSAVATFKAK